MNRIGPLTPYLTEMPAKTASNLRCKAFAINVLEKISWVAFFAIMGTIFAVSYAGVALTGNLPMLLVGMALFSPLLSIGASQLSTWSDSFARRAELEEGVAKELRAISRWRSADVEAFFREQGLHIDQVPMEALRVKNSQEPLSALLPLIARFKFLHRLEVKAEESSRELLRKIDPNPEKPIPEMEKRNIRLSWRRSGWRQHECEAIPTGLNAAVMLHLIENPMFKKLELLAIGECRAKTFEGRRSEREFPPFTNEYFVFKPSLNRPPLTLDEIEQDMAPKALRLKLFPRAIRA